MCKASVQWKHIQLRIQQRSFSDEEHDAIIRKLVKLFAAIKEQKTPGSEWFVTVNNQFGKAYGFIVGRGYTVCSYLDGQMFPKGKEVRI